MKSKGDCHRRKGEASRTKDCFLASRLSVVVLLGVLLQLSTMHTTNAFVATTNLGRFTHNKGTTKSSSSSCRHGACQSDDEGTDRARGETTLSRRSALLSAARSASAAVLALSIDPSRALAREATVTPVSAAWKSVDGLNTMEEDAKNFVGFDAKAYQAMIADQTRTPVFYKAMEERIKEGDVVLDLGTGPFAIFAIRAAELGAKKVYAIEANSQAAKQARETVTKKGFDDIIEVLEGFSTDITLPNEDKVDLVVAEIIGSICSEEGVVATIADAHKRFAKNPTSPFSWIPSRVQTYAAPASYTLHNLFGPPGFDWNKLNGEPVRFSCRDEGLQLLSDPQLVEDIVFADVLNFEGAGSARNKVLTYEVNEKRTQVNQETLVKELQRNQLGKSEATRVADATSHSFSGMAFWPRLILSSNDESITIASRRHPDGGHQRSHWQTVLPIMKDRPVPVRGGDTIAVTTKFDVPTGASGTKDITTPASYRVEGTVTSTAEANPSATLV